MNNSDNLTKSTQNDSRSRVLGSRNVSDLSQTSSTTTNDTERRRLPPSKTPVGLARSPDLTNCKSKVGSLHNIKHSPAGGKVTIHTQKLHWNAKSKVGSLDNKEHKPAGGNVKVESKKLDWKTSSKVQSLANINHKPGGGNVKIFNDAYRQKSALPNKLHESGTITTSEKTNNEAKSSPNRTNKRPTTLVEATSSRSKDAPDKLATRMKAVRLEDI